MPRKQERSRDVDPPKLPPLGQTKANFEETLSASPKDLADAAGDLAGRVREPLRTLERQVELAGHMLNEAVAELRRLRAQQTEVEGRLVAEQLRADDKAAAVAAVVSSGSHDREAVIDRATEVIGDEQAALRWLGTPVRALDYATPISRLNDAEGQAAVLNVLTQLEHGVL